MPKRQRLKAWRIQSADLLLSSLRTSKMPGMTRDRGGSLAQACSVCLADQGHSVICNLSILGCFQGNLSIRRLPVNYQLNNTFAFESRATEDGACCLAILLLLHHTKLSVLWESKRGTGYDYFLGTDPNFPFRDGARLEVSGIRHGSEADIQDRVREKVAQISPNNHRATGYIVVVEFSRPEARILEVCSIQEN